MRLSVRDVMDFVRIGLGSYWQWMRGSLLRFSLGYATPLAAIVLAVHAVNGDNGIPAGLTNSARPSATAEVAGASAGNTNAGPPTSPTAAATPTGTRSVLTYVVKSGDSLGAICSAQVRSMEIDACVAAIVELNKLAGPDQLSVGQSLTLPATAGASSPGSLTSAGAPATATGQPATASTPGPSNTAAPRLQDINFDSLSSPVKAGETAMLRATVAPHANCSLQYAPPNGTQSVTNSLLAKVADSAGSISWSWDIDDKTKKGKGLVVVTCGGTSLSAYIEIS